MNSIFKYKSNAKYSSKDLKGGYTGNDFMVLDAYLKEKDPPDTIHFLKCFKDHHIVSKLDPKTGYDEWILSNALRMKIYNSHGKYRPKLSKYFQI